VTLERSLEPELLDDLVQDPEELAASLQMVSAVNRWLGGLASVQRHLHPYRHRPCRILDIGTGNGDTAADLLKSLGSSEWTVTGVDLSPLTARIAQKRHGSAARARFVAADALRLPFPRASFDVVVSFLTLHHFDAPTASRIVAEMGRVSRGLVLVSDLERHRLNYWGARLMAATLWRANRLTRSDGPLSVLKSFRPQELLEIGEDAGLTEPRVGRHFFFRLVLAGGRAPDGEVA